MFPVARKQVVLIIVEGMSDQVALEGYLSDFLVDEYTRFIVVHGDILTDRYSNQGNIRIRIGDLIKREISSYGLKKKDIKEIVHLVDTDGIYIPDDHIIVEVIAESPIYEENAIKTNNRSGIIARNAQKRTTLHKLITCSTILDIPYHVYYMSCNLDHVLYNKPNATEEEKENDSEWFSLKYDGNLAGFLSFICSSVFSTALEYRESWKFIQQNLNSLHRHTNFNLFFEEYRKRKIAVP